MKLTFKGGKTSNVLEFNTETKTYLKFNGIGGGAIRLETQKELRELELDLIRNGYTEEK